MKTCKIDFCNNLKLKCEKCDNFIKETISKKEKVENIKKAEKADKKKAKEKTVKKETEVDNIIEELEEK